MSLTNRTREGSEPAERSGATERSGWWQATRLSDRGALVVGVGAVVASIVYFVSDVVETRQDGFSSGQLWLTLAAEAAVPFFVVGLAVAQHPHLGRVGDLSAWAYAYAFVFFTGTVVYALVNDTPDYAALTSELGVAMVIHGAVMVLAGVGFGYAVIRAQVFPSWTGLSLIAGVILVAITQDAPSVVQLTSAGIRDVAFAGMGVALLRRGRLPADLNKPLGSGPETLLG